MTMATLLTVTVLHFTTPDRNDSLCLAGAASGTPLSEVALVSQAGDTLARHTAAALGAPDSIEFDWTGQPLTVFLVSRKSDSPWSCPSNSVSLGSATSVPPDWPTAPAPVTPRRRGPCGSADASVVAAAAAWAAVHRGRRKT